jgi:8-amino-7-oxononanoate synthase
MNPRDLARYCQASGFVIRPIVPPTVPQGTQRVRVCLHAGNTHQDIDKLVKVIENWLEKVESSYTREARKELFLKASM